MAEHFSAPHLSIGINNSEDKDKDNSGHVHMVESNTMSEDVIERGIVKQSPSPSSVDETLGKYGDVVSDASSSRFGSQCQHTQFLETIAVHSPCNRER